MHVAHNLVEAIAISDTSGVLGLLVIIAGGICALVLVNQKTLRDSRDDQRHRIEMLEEKSERDDKTIAEQTGRIEALSKIVTGEARLVEISDLLSTHHAEAIKQWLAMAKILSHVDTTLEQFPRVVASSIKQASAEAVDAALREERKP